MEYEILGYQDGIARLTKSTTLIGLQAREGRVPQAARAIIRALGEVTRYSFGGFQLIDVTHVPLSADEALNRFRAHPDVAVGTHVYYVGDSMSPIVPTGQLTVVFGGDATFADCQRLMADYRLQLLRSHGEWEFIVRVTRESPNPLKTAAALRKSPLVHFVEPELAGLVH